MIMKPITKKYQVITLMKWMFPMGVLMNLPFGTKELLAVEWQLLPWDAIWRIGFVLIFTTFLAYLLNMYALREVPPTTIGVLTYVQPIIAIVYATFTGNDQMDLIKSFCYFTGVCRCLFSDKKIQNNVDSVLKKTFNIVFENN